MKNLKYFKICFLFALVAMLQIRFVNAQNLVPNPSFEECDTCPYGTCQIHYAKGWHSCSGTPDYCNACAFLDEYSVPNSIYGYQYPLFGNAYAVFRTYCEFNTNLREFIGVELFEPLEIGRDYFVSFNVSLANNSKYCNNKIGALFTVNNYFLPPCIYESGEEDIAVPNNYSHLYTDDLIMDTTNWTNISGWFTADSTYNFLIIGNFFDDSHTYYEQFQNTDISYVSSYYIDNVYVGKDTLTDIVNVSNMNQINIYPNPVKSSAQLNISKSQVIKEIMFRLFDLMGKDCSHQINIEKQNCYKYKIERNDIPDGIYILEIVINETKYTQKIMFN